MIPYIGGLLKDNAIQAAMKTDPHEALAGVRKYKLKPPRYNGDYGTFEERRCKFQAYMGLQHGDHERLMRQSERADTDLETAAQTQERSSTMEAVSARDEVHKERSSHLAVRSSLSLEGFAQKKGARIP